MDKKFDYKQGFLDRFTRSDELMAEMIPLLKRIESGDITVNIPGDGRTISDIYRLIEEQHAKDYEIFYLTYPNDGTRATFDVGTTILDFDAATIKAPDSNVTKMSTSLRKQKKDFMRSFAVNCNHDIVVQLDENDKSPVRANVWSKMTYQQFTKAYITATVATTGYIHACTNPEAIHEQIGEATVAVGKKTIGHIDSDKDSHFTTAIAQNAIETENITGMSDSKVTITGVSIQADEALNFRLWFFGTDGHTDTDLDVDEFVDFVNLDLSTNGARIGATGQYYFAQTGLMIDYSDEDASEELHLALQNLSAAAKTAGAAGEVKVKILYRPRL